MDVIALIAGAIVLFVGGFVLCYVRWHRSVEWAFEEVFVGSRSARVLRMGLTME
jgi:hypothetical protein